MALYLYTSQYLIHLLQLIQNILVSWSIVGWGCLALFRWTKAIWLATMANERTFYNSPTTCG